MTQKVAFQNLGNGIISPGRTIFRKGASPGNSQFYARL